MFTPYTAEEAKLAADAYHAPLIKIFDFIRLESNNGLYAVNVSGTELSAAQITIIQKCGFAVEAKVDEQGVKKYNISWA